MKTMHTKQSRIKNILNYTIMYYFYNKESQVVNSGKGRLLKLGWKGGGGGGGGGIDENIMFARITHAIRAKGATIKGGPGEILPRKILKCTTSETWFSAFWAYVYN